MRHDSDQSRVEIRLMWDIRSASAMERQGDALGTVWSKHVCPWHRDARLKSRT